MSWPFRLERMSRCGASRHFGGGGTTKLVGISRTGVLVGYESGEEHDVLMALNADQTTATPSSRSRSTRDVVQFAAHDLQTPQISQRAAP